MIANRHKRADTYANPLIHGADLVPSTPVDTSTVTRRWARGVLKEQRETVEALLRLGERLRNGEGFGDLPLFRPKGKPGR